jgi:hypothetical protein
MPAPWGGRCLPTAHAPPWPAGLDWDELEEQAAQEDRERHFSDDEREDIALKKRKAKGSGGGGGGAGKRARR